jgi:DNA-binding response OmpR family regulator
MVRARLTHQVLVIDDDPHIAATIVAALKDRYQVHVATDDRGPPTASDRPAAAGRPPEVQRRP